MRSARRTEHWLWILLELATLPCRLLNRWVAGSCVDDDGWRRSQRPMKSRPTQRQSVREKKSKTYVVSSKLVLFISSNPNISQTSDMSSERSSVSSGFFALPALFLLCSNTII